MQLPDNSSYQEITTEHISTIQERLGKVLADAYPGYEDIEDIVNNHFELDQLKGDILSLFTQQAFLTLFKTEMGKGVIIGAFIQEFIFTPEEE